MSWFKVHRGWMSDPAFKNNDQRIAWMWMVEHAAIEAKKIAIKGNPVTIGRGQLSHSIRFMANAIGVSKQSMETILKHFKKWDMIKTESKTGQNIITICNYTKYQSKQDSTKTDKTKKLRQHQDSTKTIIKNKRTKEEKKDIPLTPEKDFQEFWNACPVQIAQADTEEEYILALEEVEPKALLKAIKAYAASVEGTDIQYIKQPANWLHDKRYTDKTGFEAVEIDSSAWPDWKRALAVLIGDVEVHSWFSDAETEGNTVYVKNSFTAQWIRNNYDRELSKTLGKQYTIKLLGERT